MSRGGRGGFRGGRDGGMGGAMQLVSFDLLKDLGSDTLFNVQTALFPEMDVPMPRKPGNSEKIEWDLKQDCTKMLHASPFHLVPPRPPPEIERYSDKYRKDDTKKRSLRDIKTDLDFFPEELQSIIDPSKAKKKRKARQDGISDFSQIEALLDKAGKEGDENAGDEEDEEGKEDQGDEEGVNEEDYEDEEELVDDNDYAQNYFDNGEGDDIDEDDGDGGDYY